LGQSVVLTSLVYLACSSFSKEVINQWIEWTFFIFVFVFFLSSPLPARLSFTSSGSCVSNPGSSAFCLAFYFCKFGLERCKRCFPKHGIIINPSFVLLVTLHMPLIFLFFQKCSSSFF
jgi:hypothetical protein